MGKALYSTTVTATGGREGHVVSDDGILDLQVRRPKTNGVSEGTNPEQLFAAAWAACYQSALGAAARQTGDDVSESSVAVTIGIGGDNISSSSGLVATIAVDIPGLEPDKVQQIADAAHEMCPYSRVTRGNIDVEIKVGAPTS
jgi:osmotically inducible protein OsmC